jgi:hypothetical protein
LRKEHLHIGDRVAEGGLTGTVVAIIDRGEFSPEYPAADWAYLGTGVLVLTREGGLVHYPDMTQQLQPRPVTQPGSA